MVKAFAIFLIFISVVSFVVKFVFHFKFALSKKIFLTKIVYLLYLVALGYLLPLLPDKNDDEKIKRQKKIANIALVVFWGSFLLTMIFTYFGIHL